MASSLAPATSTHFHFQVGLSHSWKKEEPVCFLGISQAIAVYTGLVRAWSHGYPQSHGIVGNVVEVRIPHVDQNRLWALRL